MKTQKVKNNNKDNFIKLSPEESKLYFDSDWYKKLAKARKLKLINLGLIKEN